MIGREFFTAPNVLMEWNNTQKFGATEIDWNTKTWKNRRKKMVGEWNGDLMWQPECPGPEWQLGKEWIDNWHPKDWCTCWTSEWCNSHSQSQTVWDRRCYSISSMWGRSKQLLSTNDQTFFIVCQSNKSAHTPCNLLGFVPYYVHQQTSNETITEEWSSFVYSNSTLGVGWT
jgi:hypothetical protein